MTGALIGIEPLFGAAAAATGHAQIKFSIIKVSAILAYFFSSSALPNHLSLSSLLARNGLCLYANLVAADDNFCLSVGSPVKLVGIIWATTAAAAAFKCHLCTFSSSYGSHIILTTTTATG